MGADGIRPFALASADGRGGSWRPGPADDPFAPATRAPATRALATRALAARALAATLPVAEVAVTRGCHDGRFWQHLAPAQLRFLAAAFTAPR